MAIEGEQKESELQLKREEMEWEKEEKKMEMVLKEKEIEMRKEEHKERVKQQEEAMRMQEQTLHTPGILHAKTIIRSETIFFATARIILEPGREFNY